MREFLGFTWVGWTNIILFQWFFVRLARIVEVEDQTKKTIGYVWITGVVPMTGWSFSPWKNLVYLKNLRSKKS